MTARSTRERTASSLLSEELLAHLVQLGSTQRFQQAEVIFAQADRGATMYVVEAGQVDLSFVGGRQVKRLGPAEFFGELALVTGDHVRTATAVAATEATLRVIDQHAFEALLERTPTVSVELLRRTCAYLLDSEQSLVGDLIRRNRELEQTLDYLRRTREDLDATQLVTLTDELTGLYNRRCLTHQSENLLRQAEHDAFRLALILIDIDRFKEINDTLGHPVGDLVLRRFAEALRRSLRQTDLPCRVGGDEFAILLANPGENEAETLAQRLLRTMAGLELHTAGRPVNFTCSIGGGIYHRGETWEELYARVDQALYLAKEQGRNRVAWEGRILARGDE